MPHLFIELYNYKQAWRDLRQEEREVFRANVLEGLETLVPTGLEVIGWGFNDVATDHRAGYDFFCVYRAPSGDFIRRFEHGIRQSGWHDLFEQVAISGAILPPSEVLAANMAFHTPALSAGPEA